MQSGTQGHVILTNDDPVFRSLIRKLEKFHYEYVVLVEDADHAARLIDEYRYLEPFVLPAQTRLVM